jgi:hypothetical protein
MLQHYAPHATYYDILEELSPDLPAWNDPVSMRPVLVGEILASFESRSDLARRFCKEWLTQALQQENIKSNVAEDSTSVAPRHVFLAKIHETPDYHNASLVDTIRASESVGQDFIFRSLRRALHRMLLEHNPSSTNLPTTQNHPIAP